MSVDPASPATPEPSAPKPPVGPNAEHPNPESADAVKLKRRFRKGGAEGESEEKPDQTIQLLSTLLQDLIAKKEQTGAPEPDARTGSKYHRLSKTGSGAAGAPSEPTAAPATDPAAGASAAEAAPPAVAGFRPAPVFDPDSQRKRVRRLHILYPLAALALAAAAYFAGARFGSNPPETGKPGKEDLSSAGPTWNEASLQQLDQALTADAAGNLEDAKRIALTLKKPGSALPGLDLYLDSLLTRLDHFYDVEADLLRSNNGLPPMLAAAISEALAFNFSRSRDFDKANEFFAVASRTNPFPAPLFYHWGETLRHQGHLQDAIGRFREALARIPTGRPENASLRECAEFKIRLALVELGRDGDFQKELAERLQSPTPSGYWLATAAAMALQRSVTHLFDVEAKNWLLAAAASALQHKNLTDAAGFLGRAREALGAAQFDGLLNDYFFRAYADRKELADFFPTDQAARRRQLSASMAYSIEP